MSMERNFEGEEITEYGIICKNKKNEVLQEIKQITTRKQIAANMVEILNQEDVDPVHFPDIIDDFLVDPGHAMWKQPMARGEWF